MIPRWIKPDLNLNVKSTWNQIRVNGIADADGDVVEAGVIEFGITADGIFLMTVLHAVIHAFFIHSLPSLFASHKCRSPLIGETHENLNLSQQL